MESQDAAAAVEIINIEANKLVGQFSKLKIRSNKQLNEAAEGLTALKRLQKEIEKRRKSFVDPLNRVVKQINAEFKEPLARIAESEKNLKNAIGDFQQRMELKALKASKEIEEQVDKGQITLDEAIAQASKHKLPDQNIRKESGSINTRFVQKIRITDVSSLPTSYFTREAVVAAVQAEVEKDFKTTGLVPPGAEMYEERRLAVRTA